MQAMLIILGAIAGLVTGSFLATLVVRWPRGQNLSGRSACDHCGTRLRAVDLIPLLSFAVHRGRCHACAAPIDRHHPWIEAACGLAGALAFWAEPSLHGFAGAIFGWILITLIVLDAEHYWLPDALTLSLLALGLWLGQGVLADRLIGAAAGGGVFLLLAWGYQALRGREGLGLGDVKLIAALGAWLGWQMLPPLILVAAIIGLLWAGGRALAGGDISPRTQLPFGTCLGIAALPLWFLG